jgi:hypothetical protein
MNRFIKIFGSLRAAWIVALSACACLCFMAVWFGGLNQDEGWYLYAAQSVHEGKIPYRDFFYTQGPAMPFVYSVFAPLWHSFFSPVQGLLGGRLVTLGFGFLTVLLSVLLARALSPKRSAAIAGFSAFAFFACNIYHLYFNAIPKTYALAGAFVIGGFLFFLKGIGKSGIAKAVLLFVSGFLFAGASGTRISLALVPIVASLSLLFAFRSFKFAFLPFGIGALSGFGITYGIFLLDVDAFKGLLFAQWYHASRGGFDFFFAAGSVLRLLRGYAALAVVAFLTLAFSLVKADKSTVPSLDCKASFTVKTMLLSFAAVFLLQLSAPFPYDDYQVPVMGLAAIPLAAGFARLFPSPQFGWFALAVTLVVSASSPLLQDWTTYAPDRFWSRKAEMTELAKLRQASRVINDMDPDGNTILTQDLYLAIETSRKVPEGLEMGPFSLFPGLTDGDAKKFKVHNVSTLTNLIASSGCSVAAMSGYGFAIAAPKCDRTSAADLTKIGLALDKAFEPVANVPDFGQNETTLTVYKRRQGGTK